MSEDGYKRIAYMRREQLLADIVKLGSEHPVNRYNEDYTSDEFTNGYIMHMRDEIEFLDKFLTY